jgi:putative flippase GtrA
MKTDMLILSEVKIFAKAQFSAFFGGMVDLFTMFLLTEFYSVHYIHSLVVGGIVGALVNYSINRYWTFEASGRSVGEQLSKFVCVVIGSITLKSIGTYFFTEVILWDYKISRIVTDAFVAFGFNYVLQKYWVFR